MPPFSISRAYLLHRSVVSEMACLQFRAPRADLDVKLVGSRQKR